MCLFLVMFVYNLVCGKSNLKLTNIWYEANKEFFQNNYQKIGIREEVLNKMAKQQRKGIALPDKKIETKDKFRIRKILSKPKQKKKIVEKKQKINILQQSNNIFKFFAFNKSNVKSLIVNFEVSSK